MQNFCLTLQYDGTRYLGWSRPKKDGYDKTVSFKIKNILKKLTNDDIILYGGAKTEPGVHALMQTASFHTDASITSDRIRETLNRYLPQDIAVLKVENMPERFRADLNALSRTYECRICTAPVYDVFAAAYQIHLFPPPDMELMKQAARSFIGTHDFRPFSATRKKKTVRKTVQDISFSQDKDLLTICITADDFLPQMAAIIGGTLVEAGLGSDLPLQSQKAGSPLEAKGLLLQNIRYKI